MLTQEIAEEIVKETMSRLNRNINIIDLSGKIIASGDPSRINQIHEGGLHVIKTGNSLVITEENKHEMQGSKLGINLPIEFQNKIIGVIGITGDQKEVEEFGDLVKMTTELMVRQAYIATESEWRQRTKEETFQEIIRPIPNVEIVNQQLELLQLKLIPPFHFFLIEIDTEKIQSQLLIRKIEGLFNNGKSLIGFLEVGTLFILTSGISGNNALDKIELTKKLLSQQKISCKIGYGTAVNHLEGMHTSFNEAKIALLLCNFKDTSVISYSDVEAEALIFQVNEQLKKRFLQRIYPHLSNKIVETLQAFFNCNLNITETANKLYIHRNTLIYRLKKVKEDTGFDPQVFKDALPLQLAIWIYVNSSTPNSILDKPI